ncbi:hypothetical protein EVAR_45303_1 [Eumeta japonica]|uniref:Uncharacterized protein n=1 Tax=Eumeta variegata TaxID=151549 RepID=A0A4C1Y7V4_EUMVA|nr:hypothetical protein EVAR_45303_1 [Eumeta japonica]
MKQRPFEMTALASLGQSALALCSVLTPSQTDYCTIGILRAYIDVVLERMVPVPQNTHPLVYGTFSNPIRDTYRWTRRVSLDNPTDTLLD